LPPFFFFPSRAFCTCLCHLSLDEGLSAVSFFFFFCPSFQPFCRPSPPREVFSFYGQSSLQSSLHLWWAHFLGSFFDYDFFRFFLVITHGYFSGAIFPPVSVGSFPFCSSHLYLVAGVIPFWASFFFLFPRPDLGALCFFASGLHGVSGATPPC